MPYLRNRIMLDWIIATLRPASEKRFKPEAMGSEEWFDEYGILDWSSDVRRFLGILITGILGTQHRMDAIGIYFASLPPSQIRSTS